MLPRTMEGLKEEIKKLQNEMGLDVSLINDSSKTLNLLFEIFELDTERLYLWESKKGEKFDYSQDSWVSVLKNQLADFEEVLYLVVTDDEFPPWLVYKCKKGDLLKLLPELRFFEYFLFDERMKKVVFDNHHNQFIVR